MDKIQIVSGLFPMIALITSISVAGWVITTWLRIKNGYPLDGAWGQALHPKTDRESMERIKLLSTENAQLRAELGSVKDRLETIERIGRVARPRDDVATDARGDIAVVAWARRLP